jgi:hypothetical protein
MLKHKASPQSLEMYVEAQETRRQKPCSIQNPNPIQLWMTNMAIINNSLKTKSTES